MQDAGQLLSQGPTGAVYQKYAAGKKASALPFNQLANQYVSDQQHSFLVGLDHSPSATPGFKPSAAFVDLLNNPDFQQAAVNMSQNQATTSAGDYAVNSIAGTNFASAMFNHNRNMTQAFGAQTVAQRAQAISTATKLRNASPVDAATLTMHALPNITEADGNQLLGAVMPVAAQLIQSGKYSADNQGDAIDAALDES